MRAVPVLASGPAIAWATAEDVRIHFVLSSPGVCFWHPWHRCAAPASTPRTAPSSSHACVWLQAQLHRAVLPWPCDRRGQFWCCAGMPGGGFWTQIRSKDDWQDAFTWTVHTTVRVGDVSTDPLWANGATCFHSSNLDGQQVLQREHFVPCWWDGCRSVSCHHLLLAERRELPGTRSAPPA
jgi:hypothetical protein